MQLQIEEISLKKEKANEKLEVVRKELQSIGAELAPLMAQYERERGRIQEIAAVKKKIDDVRQKMERAAREGQLDKAADLRYYALPDLQKQLEKMESEQKEIEKQSGVSNDDDRLVKSTVTPEVVATVVSRWTGIPVTKIIFSCFLLFCCFVVLLFCCFVFVLFLFFDNDNFFFSKK